MKRVKAIIRQENGEEEKVELPVVKNEAPRKVRLPFLPEWKEAMLSGRKTATSRTRRFGNTGDTLSAFGTDFVIIEVLLLPLKQVAEEYWLDEGCNSPEHFKQVWNRLHPYRGWRPEQMVYFHRFALASFERCNIQYVECNEMCADLRDWPDCYEDCWQTDECPVIQRMRKDREAGTYCKVLKYTVWPE